MALIEPPHTPIPIGDKEMRIKVVDLVLAFHRDAKTGADTGRIMNDITKIYEFITKFIQ